MIQKDELQSNTRVVVDRLIDQVRIGLSTYDDNHFDQIVPVRLHLYKYEEKLKAILDREVADKEKEWLVKYAMLYGFVCDMCQQFQQHREKDQGFAALLDQLFNEISFDVQIDLSDNLIAD